MAKVLRIIIHGTGKTAKLGMRKLWEWFARVDRGKLICSHYKVKRDLWTARRERPGSSLKMAGYF
jgi:hypothetical protein